MLVMTRTNSIGVLLIKSVPIVEEDEDEPEDIADQVKQRHESKIVIVSCAQV